MRDVRAGDWTWLFRSRPRTRRSCVAGKTRYSARIKQLSQVATPNPGASALAARVSSPVLHQVASLSRYDLHCHSTHSDGLLTPDALVRRAALRGVEVLALTDHDDTGGLAEAQNAATDVGIELVPGAELSVSWESHTIHVVALRIDAANA